MPNWCEGTLKVRGTKKDIKRFVLEGLKPVGFGGEELAPIKEDEYGDIDYAHTCWIKNTYRGFIEGVEIYFSDIDDDCGDIIISFDARFAWAIDASELLKTCKEFNVDMKIYAFECGQEFNQAIEIVNGEILCDKTITFDDYEWECICPKLGG